MKTETIDDGSEQVLPSHSSRQTFIDLQWSVYADSDDIENKSSEFDKTGNQIKKGRKSLGSSKMDYEIEPNRNAIVKEHLPAMFRDLLEPVRGTKYRKLSYECNLCGERLATFSSLVVHNKAHAKPLCLHCDQQFQSHSKLVVHSRSCISAVPKLTITSKYGRARNVLANVFE